MGTGSVPVAHLRDCIGTPSDQASLEKFRKKDSEMRARWVLTTGSALLLMAAAGSPAFAKAHPQPSPVADLLGQEVSSTVDGHAENGDARGILDGQKGIQNPQDSGQTGGAAGGAVEPARGGRASQR